MNIRGGRTLSCVVNQHVRSVTVGSNTAFDLTLSKSKSISYSKFQNEAVKRDAEFDGKSTSQIEDLCWEQLKKMSFVPPSNMR